MKASLQRTVKYTAAGQNKIGQKLYVINTTITQIFVFPKWYTEIAQIKGVFSAIEPRWRILQNQLKDYGFIITAYSLYVDPQISTKVVFEMDPKTSWTEYKALLRVINKCIKDYLDPLKPLVEKLSNISYSYNPTTKRVIYRKKPSQL